MDSYALFVDKVTLECPLRCGAASVGRAGHCSNSSKSGSFLLRDVSGYSDLDLDSDGGNDRIRLNSLYVEALQLYGIRD